MLLWFHLKSAKIKSRLGRKKTWADACSDITSWSIKESVCLRENKQTKEFCFSRHQTLIHSAMAISHRDIWTLSREKRDKYRLLCWKKKPNVCFSSRPLTLVFPKHPRISSIYLSQWIYNEVKCRCCSNQASPLILQDGENYLDEKWRAVFLYFWTWCKACEGDNLFWAFSS